jgi:succinoglycan biosynthesis transport protein ExoP
LADPSPSASSSGLDLEIFRIVLREQRLTIVLFFCAVVFGTLVMTLLTTRKYEATSLIHLMPRAGLEVAVDEVVKADAEGYLEGQARARTQIQIIYSRSVLDEVITYYRDLGYGEEFPEGPDSTQKLARMMRVQPRENTQLVEIAVEHVSPQKAAVLSNLVADVYCSFNLDSRTIAARESIDWIDTRIESAQKELQAATAKVIAFKRENGVVDIEKQVSGVTTRLDALQAALGDTTAERVLLESELDNYNRLMFRGEYLVLAGMFPGDAALETLARRRATISVETADVLSRYGEQHPEHQRAVEQVEQVDSLLAQTIKKNVEGVRSRAAALARQEERIQAEMLLLEEELLERQRLQREYSVLAFEEERAQELYDSLKSRVTEVDLQASSELNDVRIVDRAVPPSNPSSPNMTLNMAAAIMVGAFGGLALALVRVRFWPSTPPKPPPPPAPPPPPVIGRGRSRPAPVSVQLDRPRSTQER